VKIPSAARRSSWKFRLRCARCRTDRVIPSTEEDQGIALRILFDVRNAADKDDTIAAVILGVEAAFEQRQSRFQRRAPGDAGAARGVSSGVWGGRGGGRGGGGFCCS